MQDEDIRSIADDERALDVSVLTMLARSRAPWAVEEVAREVGNAEAAADALTRLTSVGLVHRIGAFVFPSRAGARAAELGWS